MPAEHGVPKDRTSSGEHFSTLDRNGIAKLVRNNPSAQVISMTNLQNRFGENGEKFMPSLFQAIQTVRVRSADGEIIELIRDGHHRAKYLDNNFDTLIGTEESPGRFPHFRIPKQDVTKDVLFMFGEKQTGEKPTALSMTQYWLDVLPYTHQHAEVEKKRTISHLLTGWQNAVGRTLAERYSGFAALCVMTDPTLNFSDYFATEPDGEKLVETLSEMQNIISQANIPRAEVKKEAALLIYEDAESIGGREEGKRQLQGLFGLPSVASKFEDKDLPEYNDALFGAFRRAGGKITNNIDLYYKIFIDPAYTKSAIRTILAAQSPLRQLQALDHQMAIDRRKEEYKQKTGKTDLTVIEERFLSKGFVDPSFIMTISEEITTARRRITFLPPGSEQGKEIQRRIDGLLNSSRDQIHAALNNLQSAVADSLLVKKVEQSATSEQPITEGRELLFLRGFSRNLKQQLERAVAEKEALSAKNQQLSERISDLEQVLDDAGIIYQKEDK